jgi:hypothetical protein
MPDQLLNGSLLTASLVVRDVEDTEYRCEVSFWVEPRAVVAKRAVPNRGLFEPALDRHRLQLAGSARPLQTFTGKKLGGMIARKDAARRL